MLLINNISQMKQQPLNKQMLLSTLKTMIKTGHSLHKWQKQMKNSKQRFNILKQWQTTQRSYIQDLGIIQNDIQKPLRDAKLITDQQERLLFPNIKAMVELSNNLSKCIEDNIMTWNPNTTMIGENLIVFHKFFMIYREYCNNFMKAQQVVKNLKTNPNALKIQQKLKLDFASYTIKPVQRPPKYQLLLRQYHKCLHKTHKDYKIIQQAIQKYHQVNQLNNQSMDRQIRAEIMIKLDKKFGKIISSRTGREYLREFICKCNQIKCIVYAFNDMLLVTQKKNDQTEVIYKRIYLDGTSFVELKKNYKYYKNIVYVCGAVKSFHVEFQTPADTEHFQEQIGKTIKRLYRKEQERRIRFSQNEVRRRNLAKFRVSKWQDDLINKIIYKPKFQVNVISSIKKKDEAFYAINYKIISPYNISQTIILSFKKLMEVQQFIKHKHKSSQFSKLLYIPESIGIIQASRNRTKIIQHRSLMIQEFLNHIFRNQEFYFTWKSLADQLGINSDLFDFSTTQNFTCNCDLCIEMKEDQSLNYYNVLIKRLKQPHKTWIPQSRLQEQLIQQPAISRSKSDAFQNNYASQKKKSSMRCSCFVFNIYKCIRTAQKDNIDNFAMRMLTLEAEMGSINYTFLSPTNRPLKSQISFKIYLLNVEQEYIEIILKEDKYVRQILQQIGINNSLSTIYDWSLYLYEDGQYHCIGNDEKLLEFLQKWGTSIEKIEQAETQISFLKDKIDQLKKIGQQFWGSSKGKLFLKKNLYFEHQIQVQACKVNKQRYHFLINEIFGRIKYQGLYLTSEQLISMSAFFMMKNQFDRIRFWTEDNIDLNILKELLPAFHHPLIRTQRFRKQVFNDIKNHYKSLQQFQNSRNAIQLVYLKILNYLRSNQQWLTRYFFFSSHRGETQKDTLVGVNYNYLVINKVQDRKNILTIELQRLKYKTSTFSLFIYEGESQYRFDGSDAWTIRQIVQTYLTYTRLFRPK